MRHTLLLFDIDGTLVRGGPAKDSFVDAMIETYGTPGDFEKVSFAGKTDPQIARELLVSVGKPAETIEEGLDKLFELYLGNLEARLPSDPVEVLRSSAGVRVGARVRRGQLAWADVNRLPPGQEDARAVFP